MGSDRTTLRERPRAAPAAWASRGAGRDRSHPHLPASVHDVLASPGRPLPRGTRSTMEARFGQDFSQVRVHADAQAAHSAEAVGALAYTVGHDIVLGSGRLGTGRPGNDRLLAHELTHVLQQRRGSRRLQRKIPEEEERRARDPELELGRSLREPGRAGGLALAFFDEGEPEAERQAKAFAVREEALGLKGTTVTADNLGFGRAISGARSVETTVPAIAKVARDALARVPTTGTPPDPMTPARVRTLAIFAHGTPQWCSLSITTSNAPRVFRAIAPDLLPTVDVVLYTCNSARGPSEDEQWLQGTMRGGGTGSLAATVRDVLADEKVANASVWGHTTTGHTSRNFALREFSVTEGKGAAGRSYVTKYVFTDTERADAISDLATHLTEEGYSVDAADVAFQKAASAVLERVFYSAYAAANRTLEGTNIAEAAPVTPFQTAHRVVTFWKDTYWPAHLASAARKVVARLKLRKRT